MKALLIAPMAIVALFLGLLYLLSCVLAGAAYALSRAVDVGLDWLVYLEGRP